VSRALRQVALGVLLCACGAQPGPADAGAQHASENSASAQPAAQPAFCARHAEHPTQIDALFCADTGPPSITSLRELQQLLELEPFARTTSADTQAPGHLNAVVLLGLSTALPGHLVSPLNPRAFILGKNTTLAYVRGAQEVELVSQTQDGAAELVFYLLRYQQPCNSSSTGCSPGDLYTPATEWGWTEITLQDDEELENTPFDCRACHARGGARAGLLMREVDGPWTHFFDSQAPEKSGRRPELTGYDLLQDFIAAKGDERYADIDVSRLDPSTPQALEILVGLDQPLYFDALGIERERWPQRENGYPADPQASSTWQAAYTAFKRGDQLAIPHFDPRPTAPDKQARLAEAYTRYRNHELDALAGQALPDLADIFPDDPTTRAQLGLQVEPNATPEDTLIQACGPCHNNVLNQELSRARFSIDIARMPEAELDAAAERIALPLTAAGVMPPAQARALTDDTRRELAAYLRGKARSAEIDPKLAQAASAGMLGGRRPRH
jgi:cytochrome c553